MDAGGHVHLLISRGYKLEQGSDESARFRSRAHFRKTQASITGVRLLPLASVRLNWPGVLIRYPAPRWLCCNVTRANPRRCM